MKLGKLVLAVGVVAAAAFGTVDATACLRAMESPDEKKDDAPKLVAQAEQALESGKHAVATALMLKKFPAIKNKGFLAVEAAEPSPLEKRAVRILALASVRSDGAFGVTAGDAKKSSNVEWSVIALRRLNAWRAGDASLQADLGEALAKTPGGHKEALEILGKLASDDLIGSPHAYAALARLQANAGEAQKSADAVKRCEGMTSTPGICQPPKAAPAIPANLKNSPARPDARNRA